MRASKVLHDKMFGSLLFTPMRFFDTNPSGRILNRFSKDMGAIDEIMPRIMLDAVQIILVMCGILIVVLIVNPPMIVALLICVILFAAIVKLYMRPSQDLKRLEGISKLIAFIRHPDRHSFPHIFSEIPTRSSYVSGDICSHIGFVVQS